MIGNLADKIQVWGFESDLVVFKDGSIGFAMELGFVDATTWQEDRINAFAERLDQFLNGLPSHTDIQFVQDICSGNEYSFLSHLRLAQGCYNQAVVDLVKARIDGLETRDRSGELPFHGLRVFFRRPMRKLLNKKNTIFGKEDLFPEIAESEFQQEMHESEHLCEIVCQDLSNIGFGVRRLKQKEILDLIYEQWNPHRKNQIGMGLYDPEFLPPSLVFSDVGVSDRGYCIDGIHFRVLSLKSLPEVTFSSMAQALRQLPFGSRLFLSVHIPDQQKEYEALQTQRRMAFAMARGKRSGVADLESEAKLQSLEELLAELISQGEKIFDVSLQVLLSSESEDDLEAQVAETLAKVRELSGAEAMKETLAAFDIFCDLAVPNARCKERQKKIKTTNLSDFLPVFGPWLGHQDASILLRSRLGSLVHFDPFSSELTNHNMLVSGGSGSGKSFCANVLLLQLLKENPKVYIVDIGNSYGRLCEILGGEAIKFGLNQTLSLNPFDLLPEEMRPTGDKIKFLVALVELMTKEDGASGLTKLERAELEEAILRCYENSKVPQLSDLKKILLEHPETSLRILGRILTSWTGDSAYGRFLDRPTNVRLTKSLISFDLKGLEAAPDLQAVCLFLITDLVWREVQADRAVKKILLFDECWQLLENEAGSQFMGNVFRTFRKYYAGVIAISQDIDDFARSKVAGAILPNSGTKWILMQKGANQERLAEVLQLNPTESQLVSTLSQERGVFSEAFLITGDHRAVVVVEPTPLEYWIATTDPRDVAHFDLTQRDHPDWSTAEVLQHLAANYPQGLATSASSQQRRT